MHCETEGQTEQGRASPQPSSTDRAMWPFPGLHVQQDRVTFPVAQSLQEAPSSRTLDLYNYLHCPTPVNNILRLCALYKLSKSQGIKTTAGVILWVDYTGLGILFHSMSIKALSTSGLARTGASRGWRVTWRVGGAGIWSGSSPGLCTWLLPVGLLMGNRLLPGCPRASLSTKGEEAAPGLRWLSAGPQHHYSEVTGGAPVWSG